jgi:hypothetical protein
LQWPGLNFRARGASRIGQLDKVAVLAVQVREKEHQGKRERPDNKSNPRPDFEAASSTLGDSTGDIGEPNRNLDQPDRNDHQQCDGEDNAGVHDARSNAALRQVSAARLLAVKTFSIQT